jgi:hypothetical protein
MDGRDPTLAPFRNDPEFRTCTPQLPTAAHKASAERFLQGVYGGDDSVIQDLASPDIVVSYPAFTVRGVEGFREISKSFADTCDDFRTTIHETIAEADRVVLVWSSHGRCATSDGSNPEVKEELSMGGITVYQFDTNGKIVREVGEDSMPGPYGRLSN